MSRDLKNFRNTRRNEGKMGRVDGERVRGREMSQEVPAGRKSRAV